MNDVVINNCLSWQPMFMGVHSDTRVDGPCWQTMNTGSVYWTLMSKGCVGKSIVHRWSKDACLHPWRWLAHQHGTIFTGAWYTLPCSRDMFMGSVDQASWSRKHRCPKWHPCSWPMLVCTEAKANIFPLNLCPSASSVTSLLLWLGL